MRTTLTPDQQAEVRRLRSLHLGRRAICAAMRYEVSEWQVRAYLAALEQTDPQPGGPPARPPRDAAPAPGLRTVVWDLETTDLSPDIGTLLVAAFLDLATDEVSLATIADFVGEEWQREAQLALWARDQTADADILIGHNSLQFDKCFLNGVLARCDQEPIPRRVHIDTRMIGQYGLKGRLQSYRLANLADFFHIERQKDHPSKHEWRGARLLNDDSLRRIAVRCEEDVRLTAEVWAYLKPYWLIWRGTV